MPAAERSTYAFKIRAIGANTANYDAITGLNSNQQETRRQKSSPASSVSRRLLPRNQGPRTSQALSLFGNPSPGSSHAGTSRHQNQFRYNAPLNAPSPGNQGAGTSHSFHTVPELNFLSAQDVEDELNKTTPSASRHSTWNQGAGTSQASSLFANYSPESSPAGTSRHQTQFPYNAPLNAPSPGRRQGGKSSRSLTEINNQEETLRQESRRNTLIPTTVTDLEETRRQESRRNTLIPTTVTSRAGTSRNQTQFSDNAPLNAPSPGRRQGGKSPRSLTENSQRKETEEELWERVLSGR